MRAPAIIRIFRNRRLIGYCIESAVELTVCKVLITFLPFRHWSRQVVYSQTETLKESMQSELPRLLAIRRSIKWIARWVPWHSKCLDQALAAQHMLGRRGLQSTIYFGMARDSNAENRKYLAHAWVRCGDQWVIGYRSDRHYTVVGTRTLLP